MKDIVLTIGRGLAIGLANIIPGVSGGTMALVLGIYQRLLDAISRLGLESLKALGGGWLAIRAELQRIDAVFLAALGTGAAISIVSAARIMTHLLEQHHDPTYGFFFGLIFASIVIQYRLITRHTFATTGSAIAAVVLVIGLTLAMSGEERLQAAQKKALLKAASREQPQGSAATQLHPISTDAKTLAFYFVAGAIAISAMILPGISGSFMMLLMGVYFDILVCINERQIIPLGVFALGCGLGLLVFTRFLNFLLRRFHDVTMSFMLGLVLGSLYAIWPFKTFGEAGGRRVDIANFLPQTIGQNEILTLVTFLAGCALVAVFIFFETRHPKKHGLPEA
jgi:putative membrane protein